MEIGKREDGQYFVVTSPKVDRIIGWMRKKFGNENVDRWWNEVKEWLLLLSCERAGFPYGNLPNTNDKYTYSLSDYGESAYKVSLNRTYGWTIVVTDIWPNYKYITNENTIRTHHDNIIIEARKHKKVFYIKESELRRYIRQLIRKAINNRLIS